MIEKQQRNQKDKDIEKTKLLSEWLDDNKLSECETYNAKLTSRSCTAFKASNLDRLLNLNYKTDKQREDLDFCTNCCKGIN